MVLNLFILGNAISLILATLKIYVKDVDHIWDIVILVGFWTNPIFMGLEVFMGRYEYLLYINPVAGIIINTRNALLYGQSLDWGFFIWDFLYAIVLYIIGVILFQRNWQNAIEKI